MATILPDFFKSRNFASLSPSGKQKNSDAGFSTVPSSCGTRSDITITKEFRLEEADVVYGYDSITSSTPLTPVAPRSGPRMVVKCEKSAA